MCLEVCKHQTRVHTLRKCLKKKKKFKRKSKECHKKVSLVATVNAAYTYLSITYCHTCGK